MRKDGEMRMRGNKLRICDKKPRIQHGPDSCYVDSRIVGKWMISMNEQHERGQERKYSDITDSNGQALCSGAGKRGRSKRERTQNSNLVGGSFRKRK